MKELTDRRWIVFKGLLFLALGAASAIILLLESRSWRTLLLLAIALWGFCRFYYFAFYVIEHYVDREFRFSGLFAFVQYLMRRKVKKNGTDPSAPPGRS